MSFGHDETFLCTKEIVWLALFVTMSMWLFQDRFLSMVTPRYCALVVSLVLDLGIHMLTGRSSL